MPLMQTAGLMGTSLSETYHEWVGVGGKLRRNQIEPRKSQYGDWNIWLILAGRGWGKTLTGAIATSQYCIKNPGSIYACVAPTQGDLRRVMMEGPSGLLAVTPEEHLWKDSRSKAYNRSTMELHFANGSMIQGFAAIEPDRLRGPQYHRAWADELAAWRYEDAWDQLQFGLRLGSDTSTIITTTPRPIKIIKDIAKREGEDVILTAGSTFENEENLSPAAMRAFRERYEGTRLGRQELYAELLEDVEGSLWKRKWIDEKRVKTYPTMKRIVVAIDPSVTSDEGSDECGMMIGGLGIDGEGYLFDDITDVMSPLQTSTNAVEQYDLWEADRIVAEANNGGDWIEHGLRQIRPNIPYKKLHASRGKAARAEPVSALYEQGKIHHVGYFGKLEDELCTWEPDSKMASPNRLDAVVWLFTELMLGGEGTKMVHVRA